MKKTPTVDARREMTLGDGQLEKGDTTQNVGISNSKCMKANAGSSTRSQMMLQFSILNYFGGNTMKDRGSMIEIATLDAKQDPGTL